jgi:hypothetical protein
MAEYCQRVLKVKPPKGALYPFLEAFSLGGDAIKAIWKGNVTGNFGSWRIMSPK